MQPLSNDLILQFPLSNSQFSNRRPVSCSNPSNIVFLQLVPLVATLAKRLREPQQPQCQFGDRRSEGDLLNPRFGNGIKSIECSGQLSANSRRRIGVVAEICGG